MTEVIQDGVVDYESLDVNIENLPRATVAEIVVWLYYNYFKDKLLSVKFKFCLDNLTLIIIHVFA